MVALWFSLYENIFPTYCCKREKYWESKALLFLMVLFMTPLLVTYTTTRSILLLPVAATLLLLLCYYPIGKRKKEGKEEVEVTKKKEREIGPAIKSLNYYSIREIEHTRSTGCFKTWRGEVKPHESNPKSQNPIISNKPQNPIIYVFSWFGF